MSGTVGETRAWLKASYGIPHTPDTHYVIVAYSPDGLRLIACCDGTDESGSLLASALSALNGELVLPPEGGSAIVSKDDLRAVLADAWALASDPAAFNRLAGAAGLVPS